MMAADECIRKILIEKDNILRYSFEKYESGI